MCAGFASHERQPRDSIWRWCWRLILLALAGAACSSWEPFRAGPAPDSDGSAGEGGAEPTGSLTASSNGSGGDAAASGGSSGVAGSGGGNGGIAGSGGIVGSGGTGGGGTGGASSGGGSGMTSSGGNGGSASSDGSGGSGSGGVTGCAADALHMIVLQDPSEPTPSGWACISCGAADPFYGRFPVGAAEAGEVGGAEEHAHAFTLADSGASEQGGTSNVGGSGDAVAHVGHTHRGAAGSTSSESHLPPYRTLKLIQPLTPTLLLPAGALILLDTPTAPLGTELYTEQNDYFIRGGGTPETGGSSMHSHTYSASFGQFTPADTFAASGNVACSTAHAHTVSGSTSAFSNDPAHAVVVLARVTAETPLPAGMIAMFEKPPSSAWALLSQAEGLLSGKFLEGGAAPDFTAQGENAHRPAAIETQSSTPGSGAVGFLQGGQAAAHYQHTHAARITFEAADQRPPYRTVLIAKLTATGCL